MLLIKLNDLGKPIVIAVGWAVKEQVFHVCAELAAQAVTWQSWPGW